MRVMVIVKSSKEIEAGEPPSTKMLSDMANYNDELVKNGIMLAGEGLRASSEGARVKFAKAGKTSVIDGPFTETKELVAGFWIWKVKSMQEAIDWLKRAPFEDAELEIRRVAEMEDFGENMTPELREQESRQREASEKLAKGKS